MLIEGNGALHVCLTIFDLIMKASISCMALLLQGFTCLLSGGVELCCIKIKTWCGGRACSMLTVVVRGWAGSEGDVSARGWNCSIAGSDCLVAQSHVTTIYLIAMGAFVKPRIGNSQNIIDVGHGLIVSAFNTQIVPTTLTVQSFICSL